MKSILPTYFFALCVELFVTSFLGVTKRRSMTEIIYYIWDILFVRLTGLQGDSAEVAVGASWYLSGMILAMWMLYPLLRKYKGTFLYVLSPLLAAFLLGWFSNVQGHIKFSLEFSNGISLGLLRAVAEICVGCCSFVISTHLRAMPHHGWLVRAGATLGEFVCLGAVFWSAKYNYRSQADFICILLIAVGIALSFSGLSFTSMINGKINVRWAGKFCMALYLNHVVWIRMLSRWKLPISFRRQAAIVFVLSVATAVACNYVLSFFSEAIQYFKSHKRKI